LLAVDALLTQSSRRQSYAPAIVLKAGEMARLPILEFRITERAEAKFWDHGISRRQVTSVLRNRWVALANRNHRAAEYVVIGVDDSNRCITIPVIPTDDPTIWRPVTAWYCKPGEAAKLR
jgi:hypothetical protein